MPTDGASLKVFICRKVQEELYYGCDVKLCDRLVRNNNFVMRNVHGCLMETIKNILLKWKVCFNVRLDPEQ